MKIIFERGARRRAVVGTALGVLSCVTFQQRALAQCTLNGAPNPCVLNNVTVSSGYSAPNNTATGASGTVTNNSTMVFTSGANNTVLGLNSNLLLNGSGGTLTLAQTGGGLVVVQQNASNLTLTNATNVIQGGGIIGNGGLAVLNQTGGTIQANVSGQTLSLNGSGGLTNQGLLAGTGGGTLRIATGTDNTNGNVTANGGTVAISTSVTGGTLNSSGGGSLGTETGTTSTLNGVTLSAGSTYLNGNNSVVSLSGAITNHGNFQVTSGANNSTMGLNANTTLGGGGKVTLAQTGGGAAVLQQNASSLTLTNTDNTLQGAGVIGNGGLALQNNAAGVVNANVSGQTLLLNGSGAVANTGLLEATNNGTLQVSTAVANAGGNITANGGTVAITSTINGGTLNSLNGGTLGTLTGTNSAINGVTISAGSTYTNPTNATVQISGTITNNGQIALAAGANNSHMALTGDTTLAGGGKLLLSTNSGGLAYIDQAVSSVTLINQNNTIQGAGLIGNGGLTVANQANGVLNANLAGQTLTLNGSGGVNNAGLLEATNNGTLQIQTTVNNAGGHITANGGAVTVASVINGGTLDTLNGGTMSTQFGTTATLNGVTVSNGSKYTNGNNASLAVSGNITNQGTIALAAAANNSVMNLNGNTSLTGGGNLVLSTSAGGLAILEQGASSLTLTNVNNTISGAGLIGNGGLTVANGPGGLVNANVGGQTLTFNGSGGVVNAGLMEATNGGALQFQAITVNNAGGHISGTGGVVSLNTTTIQGGTLTGTLQTGSGSNAGLDGLTQGPLTISSGSTYTNGNNTTLFVTGNIINQGNIALAANANNSVMGLTANTSLTGGGTVTLTSPFGTAYIQQQASSLTLTNGETIQGAGIIGNGGLTVLNAAGGKLLANVAGQTLLLNGSGGVTNNGTLEADAGSLLHVTAPFSNFGANTLTGGTYVASGTGVAAGTVQVDAFGTTGGEILDNAASIILSGPQSFLTDAAGKDALSAFTTNMQNSLFSLQNGRVFNLTNSFSNAGMVSIDPTSSFGLGSNNFQNTAGETLVDGTLSAGTVNVSGGTVAGTGRINGNVSNTSGIVMPGDVAGTLTVNGTYTQGNSGTLDVRVAGAAEGTGYSVFNVLNAAALGGILDLFTANGFNPVAGEKFFVMNYGSHTGAFSSVNFAGLMQGLTFSTIYNPNGVEIDINGGTVSATPEPGTWLMFAGGCCALVAIRKLKEKKA